MSTKRTPSLTEIAASAGVSVMSVSYALRGSNHVSTVTRAKIVRIARQMGYQPDPLLTHLMEHLRERRIRRVQANIGVLLLNNDDYTHRLLKGIDERSRQLGYSVDKIPVESLVGKPERLTLMLSSRGINGLLLPPCRPPQSLAGLLDWGKFTTVALSYSIIAPHFHRVVPHQFQNSLLVLEKLLECGYQRPAFFVDRSVILRTNRAYIGAMAAFARDAGRPLPPPYVVDEHARGLDAWIRKHRPDVAILAGDDLIEHFTRPRSIRDELGKLDCALMDYQSDSRFAGIDQHTSLLGATAVDLLVAQLHRGERGIPMAPVVTMVEGTWIPGRSLKRWKPGTDLAAAGSP